MERLEKQNVKKVNPMSIPGMLDVNDFSIDRFITIALDEVLKAFDVTEDLFFSSERFRPLPDARYVFFWLMFREYEHYHLFKKHLSHKFTWDRTTMIHGRNKINNLRETDKVFKTQVRMIYVRIINRL